MARVQAALRRRGIQLVGAVPYRAELEQPRVRDLRDALGLRVLNRGDDHRRVRDVIVAAQAVPGLLPLLREGRLVVVPGDRHEVILSACLAAMNGVRLAGLVLTVGIEPDPRVWDLCRAAAATGLPVLLTQDYTYETAAALHRLDPEIPADDEERTRLIMSTVAAGLDERWLVTVPKPSHSPRLSPAAFRRLLTSMATGANRRIVLPEGAEPRTLRAAVELPGARHRPLRPARASRGGRRHRRRPGDRPARRARGGRPGPGDRPSRRRPGAGPQAQGHDRRAGP